MTLLEELHIRSLKVGNVVANQAVDASFFFFFFRIFLFMI